MPLFGSHCSIAGGHYKAVEEAARAGCDVVQVFTGPPQQWPRLPPAPAAAKQPQVGRGLSQNNNQWRAKPISAEDSRLFAEALATLKITHPLAHASYLINLASPDDVLRHKSIEGMVVELQRADQLGIPFVVVHPGAHTTCTVEEGITLVAASIDEIHRRLPKAKAKLALELTAGQGTCLGCDLAQLAAMVDQTKRSAQVTVCVDTCHAFAAGYDLRDRKTYLSFWRQFDALLGLERLVALHLNDSKRELGSRVDRHEHIGRGQMGLAPFAHLVNDKRFKRVPMYLETPKGENGSESWDQTNLRTLRELVSK